jgi:hypothetical protein
MPRPRMYYGPNRRRQNRRRNERRAHRARITQGWRQYYELYPEIGRPRWQGMLANEWTLLRPNQRTQWFRQRPPPRDNSTTWDNPNYGERQNRPLMSQLEGIQPGHANIQQRPVTTTEASAFPASHHSGHPVSNPRRGVGVNTNTMRSISELFQKQTGGNVFYNKLN